MIIKRRIGTRQRDDSTDGAPLGDADKGQMELYLRWLDQNEREPSEEPPIGLILCAGKSDEHVELLRLDQSSIRVAQYMTELPSQALLERKLHKAIQIVRM